MDTPQAESRPKRLGGPLLMIAALFAVWITARAMLWENPYAQSMVSQASRLLAENSPGSAMSHKQATHVTDASITAPSPAVNAIKFVSVRDRGPAPGFDPQEAQLAASHFALWQAALTSDGRGSSWRSRRAGYNGSQGEQAKTPVFPGQPPFVSGKEGFATSSSPDRWSLGVWVFGREGSVGSMITPGPAPVYGASQLGANLQYRFAPDHRRDSRAYLRAAQALIYQGETEVAVGLSARPVVGVPVRIAGEIRATDNALGRDIRPAAFAITELPPQSLPFDLTAEVYAAGGYVGGEADTLFADGLATVTRGLTSFDLRRVDDVRVSIGAGAWGGAQRGVHRVDIGPTLRVDLALGSVPARVSLDYRERVAGEATPASGVAATLSTQF